VLRECVFVDWVQTLCRVLMIAHYTLDYRVQKPNNNMWIQLTLDRNQ